MALKREFGKTIPGLKIDGVDAPYPVLNERDVRAGAGIMFVFAGISFSLALFMKNYMFLQIFVVLFTLEFFIRVIVNPYYAPFFALGHFLVRNQRPDWSGAIQKRFAWSLGLIMASSMIIISIILGIRGWLPFTICVTCLSLLWLESALGLCVGCKMYAFMINRGWIEKPAIREACPGGACSLKKPAH